MKIFLKTIVVVLIFIYSLIYFLPKENLLFLLQNNIQKQKTVLSYDNLSEKPLGLEFTNFKVTYDGISAVNVANFDSNIFFFINEVSFQKIKVDKSLSKFAPHEIKFINLSHNILNPFNISIDSEFIYGRCEGSIDLLNRVVNLKLIVEKDFKRKYRMIVNNLTKDTNEQIENREVYRYEYKF